MSKGEPCPDCGRDEFDSMGDWLRHREDHRVHQAVFAGARPAACKETQHTCGGPFCANEPAREPQRDCQRCCGVAVGVVIHEATCAEATNSEIERMGRIVRAIKKSRVRGVENAAAVRAEGEAELELELAGLEEQA